MIFHMLNLLKTFVLVSLENFSYSQELNRRELAEFIIYNELISLAKKYKFKEYINEVSKPRYKKLEDKLCI